MNDKIFDMAESVMVQYAGSEEWAFTSNELQKFAELIVRECAGLCSTHEMADEPFGGKSYRRGRHFDVMIRQHFGVEE